MTWQPGQRVTTEQDRREWEQWRKDSKREAQRWRRAKCQRIDFYPDEAALAQIRCLTGHFVGGDYSSVLNRIVREWAEGLPPE